MAVEPALQRPGLELAEEQAAPSTTRSGHVVVWLWKHEQNMRRKPGGEKGRNIRNDGTG